MGQKIAACEDGVPLYTDTLNPLEIVIGDPDVPRYAAVSIRHSLDHINHHAVEDWGVYTPAESDTGYASYDAKPTLNNSVDSDHYVGFQGRLIYTGSGKLKRYMASFDTWNAHFGTGEVVNHYCYLARDIQGTGPVTNNYGLYIQPILRGIKNFALYAAGGISYFKNTIGIGTETPLGLLNAQADGDASMFLDSYGGQSSASLTMQRKARGTIAAPAALQAGDFIGGLAMTGHNGSTMLPISKAIAIGIADENWTPTANGTAQTWWTTENGGVTISERMRLDNAGRLGVGVSAPNARLHLRAGSAKASTAPIKLNPGPLMAIPEDGAFEFDGAHLYFTVGGVRKIVNLT